jgi:hypothetical protein
VEEARPGRGFRNFEVFERGDVGHPVMFKQVKLGQNIDGVDVQIKSSNGKSKRVILTAGNPKTISDPRFTNNHFNKTSNTSIRRQQASPVKSNEKNREQSDSNLKKSETTQKKQAQNFKKVDKSCSQSNVQRKVQAKVEESESRIISYQMKSSTKYSIVVEDLTIHEARDQPWSDRKNTQMIVVELSDYLGKCVQKWQVNKGMVFSKISRGLIVKIWLVDKSKEQIKLYSRIISQRNRSLRS